MIRSSPCDFYLRYLCTHPDKYTDAQIRTLVKLQQLDFLGMEHLKRLREDCIPPTPFYPDDELHHESQRFLARERIYQLYFPDPDTVAAIKLLDHPRGKELTESLLASGAEPVWVVSMLKRVHFKASTRAIELYRHYYFNTDLVNSTELRAILAMRANIEVNGLDPDARAYKTAYYKASKSDVMALPTTNPLSPFARILSMMRFGIMPSGIEIGRIATVARMSAIVRSTENSLLGHAKKALDFALAGKVMTELMESVGDVSGDLQRSMMQMVLDTDASEVQSLHQLTEGNHSMDLMPVDQREEADVEDE